MSTKTRFEEEAKGNSEMAYRLNYLLARHRFLAFELSVAVTRQPQKFLVGLLHITCQTPIVIAR